MNSPVSPAPVTNASYRPDPRAGSKPAARLAVILLLAAAPLFSQALIDTFAGGKIRSGVPAQDVPLTQLAGLTFDAAGNLVLCDQTANVIRRIRPDGTMETLAGNGTTGFSGDGESALDATLNQPALPRFDAQGNLYFADTANYRIRRVDARGVITTIAGSGVPYRTGMDLEGPALSRSLNTIGDLAVDPAGNVYFTSSYSTDNLIRRVTTGGRIEIFAGIPHPDCYNCTDGDNGPARAARLAPEFLAADGKGNLFVSETSATPDYLIAHHIRRIGPDGIITRFAGYGPAPTSTTPVDDEAKPALDIYIYGIGSMTADSAGNVYLVQTPQVGGRTGVRWMRIRRIDTNGVIDTIAGGPPASPSPDGPPLQTIIYPGTIAADAHGNVVFTDTRPYPATGAVIREVTIQSTLVTLAGGNPKPAPDGTPARNAWFLNPAAIAFNRAGDMFIAETGSCLIRKIGANGLLATAAGTGKCGTSTPGTPNTTQDLAYPTSVAADHQGRIYLLDGAGFSYLVAADGKVSPTSLPPTFLNGKLAVDSKDRLYAMSTFALMRLSADGKWETIVAMPTQAGVPPQGFGPTSLGGIGVDPSGNVYFTGTYLGAPTDYVFRVNDDGTCTQVYGSAANQLHLGGFVRSIAVDVNNNAWLGSMFVNSTGSYTVGQPYTGYAGDGGPAQSARFVGSPASTFAPNGDLYLLDGDRVRKFTGLNTAKSPVISSGGIVNAVSYTGGAISPGELISIFGSGFAATGLQVNAPQNNRLSSVFGSTKVLFDGNPGAITAMTPTQINVFVPSLPGKTTTITVQTDGAVSAPAQLPVAVAAPALAGTALNQDSSLNSTANPAARGSVISLFGTGEGTVFPQLFSGDLSISTPFSTLTNAVDATIGGQPAEITYAGAAPLAPIGIFQINLRIPATASPGAAAVTVSVGGVATPIPVTVAVR